MIFIATLVTFIVIGVIYGLYASDKQQTINTSPTTPLPASPVVKNTIARENLAIVGGRFQLDKITHLLAGKDKAFFDATLNPSSWNGEDCIEVRVNRFKVAYISRDTLHLWKGEDRLRVLIFNDGGIHNCN